MTRADFLQVAELDRLNVIATGIDVNHDVRPDSMLVFNAIREVVEEDGFDDVLPVDNVRDRVSEIESLLRTRELTFNLKDTKNGDRFKFSLLKI